MDRQRGQFSLASQSLSVIMWSFGWGLFLAAATQSLSPTCGSLLPVIPLSPILSAHFLPSLRRPIKIKAIKGPKKKKEKESRRVQQQAQSLMTLNWPKKQLMRTDLWQRCGTHCNTKGQRLAASSHFRANDFPHSGWIKKQSPPKCGQILLCRSEFAALKQVLDGGGHREPQANISRS